MIGFGPPRDELGGRRGFIPRRSQVLYPIACPGFIPGSYGRISMATVSTFFSCGKHKETTLAPFLAKRYCHVDVLVRGA